MSVFVGDGTTGVEARADRLGLPTGTSDPASGTAGETYYNTDTNKIRVYDGSAWADLASGGGGVSLVGASSYTIGNSITLDSSLQSTLSRTNNDTSPSNGTYTLSCWVKRTTFGTEQGLFTVRNGSSAIQIYFNTNDTIRWYENGADFSTVRKFRDPSAWYHLVFAKNGSTRQTIYVNGVETDFATSGIPSTSLATTNGSTLRFGATELLPSGTSFHAKLQIANIHFIDGSALAPTAFGEILSDTGAWSPIEYTGTYPGNSFHLNFTNPQNIGSDASGSANNFTPSQIAMDRSQTNGSGTLYSSGVTYSPSVSEPAIGAFDGSLATRTNTPLTSDGYVNVTFSPAISYSSSVRFYAYAANGYEITNYYSLNGGAETTFVGGSAGFNGAAWITAATGSGTMSSFRLRLTRGSGQQSSPNLYAIEVDGVILTDKNFSGFTTDTPVLTTASTGGDAGGSLVGNYATLNPLNKGSSISLSNGNLNCTQTNTASYDAVKSTFGMGIGKWYWEVTITNRSDTFFSRFAIGIQTNLDSNNDYVGSSSTGYSYFGDANNVANANKVNNNNFTSLGTGGFTTGDTLMFAFDNTNGNLWFGKNGSWLLSGNPATNANPIFSSIPYNVYFPAISTFSSNSATASCSCNFGQRPFIYSAPSGYYGLNTSNLPTPTIANPVTAVGALIWTGTATGGNRTIGPDTTYMNFTPDLVWSKSYNGNAYHNQMYDVLRGFTSAAGGVGALVSDQTFAEGGATGGYVSAVGSGTITYSPEGSGTGYEWYDQNSSHDYIARCWNAGGTTVTGYQPSGATVACNYRANTNAGFSIISYTGPAGTSDHFVGHGLTKAPEFIITKNRDTTFNWDIYHYALADTESFVFSNTAQRTVNAFRNQDPTALLFGVREDFTTKAGNAYIAYAWHSVDGLSSFGSYIGTGSADGPYYHCGFRPQLVIIKGAAASSQWFVHDDTRIPERTDGNPSTKEMAWETAQVQYDTVGVGAGERLDILANGFKIRSSNGACNSGSVKYCVMAWARSPFKYARAR